MQKYQIGVDVGGTKTRVALVDQTFHLVPGSPCQEMSFTACGVRTRATKVSGLIVFPTPTLQHYPTYSVKKLQRMLVSYITQATRMLQTDIPSLEITAGAVSFAGVVKAHAVITKAADLYFGWGEWDETDISSETPLSDVFFLKKQLEKKNPKITWSIINDIIAAVCRYAQLPHYQQTQTLALVTISTGVGYALFNRAASAFGERDLVSLGHTIVDTSSEALACDCGGRGHLASYFSGKAIENRMREHASHELHEFVRSSLCQILREQFSSMSVKQRKERLKSAPVAALLQENASLTDREVKIFLQKIHLSADELHTHQNEVFLLSMMVTNREIVQAINSKDRFVMEWLDKAIAKFALGFQEILHQRPEKIVIMGGFVLPIRNVFLEMLISHIRKGSETQAYLRKSIEWALDDDLDGVIGSICAKQQLNEKSQGEVTHSIDTHGSTVFEVQACTEKYTSYIQTSNVFATSNVTLRNVLTSRSEICSKVMVVADGSLSLDLEERIRCYFQANAIPFQLYKIASAVDALGMKDVEALLFTAKTFKLGRRDYFITVGCRAALHCGGLAAALYRRGIPHIFIPLDDTIADLALSPNTVSMDAWEQCQSVSNNHPPSYIILDALLNPQHQQVLPTTKIRHQNTDCYKVVFTHHLFDPRNPSVADYIAGNKAFVVISEAADILYGKKIKQYLHIHRILYQYYVYAGGENNKYFSQVLELVRQILQAQAPMLICIGGGVTMDLAGFAAALTARQYIRVPTTLLGAIDAGIGIKVGCNYQGSKNFLGDFYAPLVCLNDVEFLKTVAPRDMRAGLAEIIKMGIIREPKIIKIIESYHSRLIAERFQTGKHARNLLELATYWMLRELQKNLHEDKTLKRLVDFGHAFSPFLEIKSGHRILHGEAVSVDMAICTELSYVQGYCSRETRERILNVLVAVGLPIFDEVCEAEGLFQSLKDIRLARGGSLHLPIPKGVGSTVFIEHVTDEELKRVIAHLQALHLQKQESNTKFLTPGKPYDVIHQGLLV